MSHRRKISIKRAFYAAGIGLLVLPLILYGLLHLLRPPRTDQEQQLFQGVVYRRKARSTPRPLTIHVVTIDLTAPGIGVLVTPGKVTPEWMEITARTTSEFVSEFKLQLAINGGFFFPFHEHTPWDYYPHSGDMVNVLGQAISNGQPYSPVEPGWHVLCVSADKRAQISDDEKCPEGTAAAVAGSSILVARGFPVSPRKDAPDNDDLYPRTAVGIDQQGKKLWIIVVDGRQPLYSEGVTLAELTNFVMELGAYTALNLDGGGSTTLVVAGGWGPRPLNAPIHTRIPMRQRPVANHLGIYAQPLD